MVTQGSIWPLQNAESSACWWLSPSPPELAVNVHNCMQQPLLTCSNVSKKFVSLQQQLQIMDRSRIQVSNKAPTFKNVDAEPWLQSSSVFCLALRRVLPVHHGWVGSQQSVSTPDIATLEVAQLLSLGVVEDFTISLHFGNRLPT